MIHCIVFTGKIKEIFSPADHFFAEISDNPRRKGHNRHKRRKGVRPKFPHRLQQTGKGAEKQDHPAG
jgi:hypothetical protein